MLYIVTAHRWGWLNAAMYHVWAGTDRAKAEAIAEAEVIERGDKYGCQVLACIDTDDGMRFECVKYFSSAYNEPAPYDSPYIAMHEALGQWVRDAVLHKRISVPDPDDRRFVTTLPVDPPQWLIDEVQRLLALARRSSAESRPTQGRDP
jgi:hypothetical protein